MVAFFRDKSSAGIFWVIALSSLLHANFLFFPPEVAAVKGQGFLYDLMQPLLLLPPVTLAIIYQAVIIIQSLRINYILNDLRMLQKPVFTTAMSYLLLTALFPAWNNITPELLSNSMLIWLVYRMSKLYNSPQPKTLIYNIGLIASCTVLLYHAALPVILLAFLALAILRPFKMNEWFVLLLGLITPLYILCAILFLKDDLKNIWFYLPKFHIHLLQPDKKDAVISTAITAGILVIAGLFVWQNNIGRMVIQARKTWSVLLWMLLLLLPIAFFIQGLQFDVFLLCAVPAAAFVSNLFSYPRQNIIPAILFWCTVAAVVYNNWILVKN